MVLPWIGNNLFLKLEIGKGIQLKTGNKIAILSIGTIAKNVSEAISNCKHPENMAHYDMRFVKPLDETLLHTIFKTFETIITVEDNSIKGGFGSCYFRICMQLIIIKTASNF